VHFQFSLSVSECASGEGDTENLPTVRAEADIMPFDQRPLFGVHMDLVQFLLTVRTHRDFVCLDDLDFRHIVDILLFGESVRSVRAGLIGNAKWGLGNVSSIAFFLPLSEKDSTVKDRFSEIPEPFPVTFHGPEPSSK
jgi:hypothetical protein